MAQVILILGLAVIFVVALTVVLDHRSRKQDIDSLKEMVERAIAHEEEKRAKDEK